MGKIFPDGSELNDKSDIKVLLVKIGLLSWNHCKNELNVLNSGVRTLC